ncbi:MAG TPA: 4-hydroxy-tetrahydrodipicolinate synthase [Steroidobacteraceae bacterium]|nr:4-hydroxy-tetrahydrodipicolinate synthase [Steroidobacteraceae bacterium]
MELRGCGTALVTPFHADTTIDVEALAALVEWQIASGIQFLVACGTTAETPSLSDREALDVVRIVVRVAAGRVPVIAGCTHNATREAVERAKAVAAVRGVNAILTANPYYNKPTQEGQYQHFRAIAESVPLPVVIYNIPGRTAANLEPATVARLARDCPNLCAVKESSGNLQQITELVHLLHETNVRVLAGDDNIALAAIAVGAVGLVSVASNEIPAEMQQMIGAALRNDWETARAMQRKYYPLLLANFWETSPGPVKHVLSRMGRISPVWRLPMVPPSTPVAARLDTLIASFNLNPASHKLNSASR